MIFDVVEDSGKLRAAVRISDALSLAFFFDEAPSSEQVSKKVAEALRFLDLTCEGRCEDKVYSGGELVRTDLHVPGEPSVSRSEKSRTPYNLPHTSTYYPAPPSEELLGQWGVIDSSNLACWYGIKETDNGDKFLKMARWQASWDNVPSLPGRVWTYASVFDAAGVESPLKDIYTQADVEEMKLWCYDAGLDYPVPESETKAPWTYGVYWNSDTGVIEGVKGYVRYR